jgi:hypothetical protein
VREEDPAECLGLELGVAERELVFLVILVDEPQLDARRLEETEATCVVVDEGRDAAVGINFKVVGVLREALARPHHPTELDSQR